MHEALMQPQRFVPSIAPKVVHILQHFVAGLGHDAHS